MSKLDLVQLGSLMRFSDQQFASFQTLGNTTNIRAASTTLAKPTAIAGDGTHNPTAVYDNSKTRATTLLIGFAITAANNAKVAVQLMGYSKIVTSGLYLPTQFFLGEAQGGNLNVSTALGEANAFLCDNFSLKTYASSYVNYIEPTADSSMALLLVDVRGSELISIDLAQGAATAATKAQVWIGVN